jgi:hypothetical protein
MEALADFFSRIFFLTNRSRKLKLNRLNPTAVIAKTHYHATALKGGDK